MLLQTDFFKAWKIDVQVADSDRFEVDLTFNIPDAPVLILPTNVTKLTMNCWLKQGYKARPWPRIPYDCPPGCH